MRILVQRVLEARVVVANKIIGQIGPGALVFLGIHKDDQEDQAAYLAGKLVHLRMFSDEAGKMNRSLLDVQGGALIVSQFTLYGDCSSGRRPDFFGAADPAKARALYHCFIEEVLKEHVSVQTGEFGADMKVHLINDGPVTFLIDAKL